jgi:hypothetical protein
VCPCLHFLTGSICWETAFANNVVPTNGTSFLIKFSWTQLIDELEQEGENVFVVTVAFKMALQRQSQSIVEKKYVTMELHCAFTMIDRIVMAAVARAASAGKNYSSTREVLKSLNNSSKLCS